MTLSYRPTTAEDEMFLRCLFESTRDDLALLPAELRAPLLDMQFRSQRGSYRVTFPDARYSMILVDQIPVGRMILDEQQDSIHLVDISILPEFRNRGIGSQVLRELISRGKPVNLMVRKENRAYGLYRRVGFEETVRDEMYVRMTYKVANR